MVEDDFGCTYTETICINIEETVACVPDPLIYCDSENDGFGEFNLIEREAQVRCGNPQGNLLVTFYETLSEAENDTNRIQDVP
jgi:hypothetical protein